MGGWIPGTLTDVYASSLSISPREVDWLENCAKIKVHL